MAALLLALPGTATAALPATSSPTLHLSRTIRTNPFVASTVTALDAEGSAYIPEDDSLWLVDDTSQRAYEVNPTTGALKSVIEEAAFEAALPLGGGALAGTVRGQDLESMAYDPTTDTLYAFSGVCCESGEIPAAFRLRRGGDGKFRVESYRDLPAGSDFTAAGFSPADGKLYVAVDASFRTYDYATNAVGTTFRVTGVAAVKGMTFTDDGADLLVVTGTSKLFRVNWATKAVVAGWTFDLTPFGILDSRAVELINNQLFIADGADTRSVSDPLSHAVFVLDIVAPGTTPPPPPPAAQVGEQGYALVASDGGIFNFGTARFFGSTGALKLNQPIVGMDHTPTTAGYWLVASDGGIFALGDARFFGSTGSLRLARPIVGMRSTPTGRGYWLVASDGGIFAFGDAKFLGSTGALKLNQPIVGMERTPSGNGYWLVASDGGIFAFGDAVFRGSTGAIKLNRPIVGMARSFTGNGYWLVASDGGIFAFGDAVFRGATGAIALNSPITAMSATAAGTGYWLCARDGGVFAFGNAQFRGSMGATKLNQPIVGCDAPLS